MLQALSQGATLGPDVQLPHLATNTAALVAVDLVDLVARAESASVERTMKILALVSKPVYPRILTS